MWQVVLLVIGLVAATVAYLIARMNPEILAIASGQVVSTVSQQQTAHEHRQPSTSIMSNAHAPTMRSIPPVTESRSIDARADEPTSQPTPQPVDVHALRDIIRREIEDEHAAKVKQRQKESVYAFVFEGWQTKDGKAVTREQIYGLLGTQDKHGRVLINEAQGLIAQAAAKQAEQDEADRKRAEAEAEEQQCIAAEAERVKQLPRDPEIERMEPVPTT